MWLRSTVDVAPWTTLAILGAKENCFLSVVFDKRGKELTKLELFLLFIFKS